MALLLIQVLEPRSGSAVAGLRQFIFEVRRIKLEAALKGLAAEQRPATEDAPKSRSPRHIPFMQRPRATIYGS